MGAFACSGSPTEPGQISDSAIVSRSQSFDTPMVQADASELTAEDGEAAETEQVDGDANSLTINTATAAAKGTVAVSGVTKDKNGKRIAGVAVKIAGKRLDTTDSRGRFSVNVRTGRTVTIKFSKTGYNNASETEFVTRAITNMNVRLTATPAALSKLSLTDGNVPVGTTVSATVTLTKAAPSGGARVMLSSSSSAADVPASVKVSAGKKSAQFQVKAESAGSATITARYNNKNVKATLTVTGKVIIEPPVKSVIAEFKWEPGQCEVVEESGGNPLLVKCRFDASDSDAPADSTYKWTFPGNGNEFTRNSPVLLNPPLKCGSVPEGAFGRTVTLVITTPSGDISAPRSRSVTFTKDGLC